MEIKLDEESIQFIKITILEGKITELEKLVNKLECRINGLEYNRNAVCFPIETPWTITNINDTTGTSNSNGIIYTNSSK